MWASLADAKDRLQQTAEEHNQALVLPCDITNETEVDAACARSQHPGGPKASHALTSKLDHPSGAAQPPSRLH